MDAFSLHLCQNDKKNRRKVLSCRLLQCLGPVHTLIVEESSKTAPAVHLTHRIFLQRESFRKCLSQEAQDFFQTIQHFM